MRLSATLGLLVLLALPTTARTQSDPATRSAALAALFKEVWEDDLKRHPELASALGDTRFNDQLTDLSPRAVNDALARRSTFLTRLSAIDTTGLPDPARLSADLLQRELIEDQQAARFKQWELPINQFHGIQTDLPAMVPNLPFTTVKDFDDYIARLHLIPRQLRQASENLLAGIADNRIQPASILEKALAQTEELATQNPETSPFALPLKKFPATIEPSARKRISAEVLEAIQTDVLPAYARFAKFLRVTELPAAASQTTPPPYHPSAFELRQTKILELRAKAQQALGPRFDLKSFHDQVTDASALPLDVLEQRIQAWIAASK